MPLFDEDYLRNFPDRAFRQILAYPEHLEAVLDMLAPDVVGGCDLKRILVEERELPIEGWRHRQADLIIRVPYRSEGVEQEILIYILIEHQSAPDPLMPLRIPQYSIALWDRQRRGWETDHPPGEPLRLSPIIPIVFHTGQDVWSTNRQLEDLIEGSPALGRFAPKWPILFWNLAEHSIEELLTSTSDWLRALAVVRAEREDAERFRQVFREVLQKLEAVGQQDKDRWQQLIKLILTWAFHRRPRAERVQLTEEAQTAYQDWQKKQEIADMSDTFKTLEQTLLEEGEAKGRAVGAIEARREDLRELLAERFGELPPELLERIDAVDDVARLKSALRQVVHIGSLDELQL